MASRKEQEVQASFDYGEAYRGLARSMRSLHIARIQEMPDIELYLDQVLSYVSGQLSFMALPDETVVTGSMVNNYVKQRIVPAPERKRYTKLQMATLLYICAFKRVYSIAQIKQMREACGEAGVDMAKSYDELVGVIERALEAQFPEDPHAAVVPFVPEVHFFDAAGKEVASDLARIMGAGIVSVANKVYVEQMLVLAERQLESEEAANS